MKQPKHMCYMCKERKEGCHSVCASYINFKKEHEKYKSIIFKNKSKQYILMK